MKVGSAARGGAWVGLSLGAGAAPGAVGPAHITNKHWPNDKLGLLSDMLEDNARRVHLLEGTHCEATHLVKPNVSSERSTDPVGPEVQEVQGHRVPKPPYHPPPIDPTSESIWINTD